MTIRTLKIFITVAEENTMHAAAKKLYISQSSVSQAISELEKQYGNQIGKFGYGDIGIFTKLCIKYTNDAFTVS